MEKKVKPGYEIHKTKQKVHFLIILKMEAEQQETDFCHLQFFANVDLRRPLGCIPKKATFSSI